MASALVVPVVAASVASVLVVPDLVAAMVVVVASVASVLVVLAVVVVASVASVLVVLVAVAVVVVASVASVLVVPVVVASVASVLVVPEINSNLLKIREGVLHFEKNEKHLFFAPDIPDWIVVNPNSAILLFKCDGNDSEEDIFNSLDLDDELKNIGRQLYGVAIQRGILKSCNEVSRPSKKCMSLNDVDLGPLRTVHLKLTDQCNLGCTYCYAESGKRSEALSLETLLRIAGEIKEISPQVDYILSGGEPLLNAHALDFAEKMVLAGNNIHLLTNGTLVSDDSIAKRIASCTQLVKVSLDGSTDSIHSITRGKYNFDKVSNGIDLLINNGANVQVAMTVTKKNAHDVSNMTRRYGSRLKLQPLFKAGRGEDKTGLHLTGAEYYESMDKVDNVSPMGNLAQNLERIRGHGIKRCAWAANEISISEKGNVYPCQLLHSS